MINSINRKIIDVARDNVIPIAVVKQMDDVLLQLTLVKNGLAFNVAGQTLSLRCKKANRDTEELSDQKYFKIDNNNVDVKIRNSFFNIDGELRLELNISDSNGSMTTATFYITVMKKELDDNAVENSEQYDVLTRLIQEYKELSQGDTNAEVIAARTDINNKVYSTLKERIDDYNSYISNEKSYNVLSKNFLNTANKTQNYIHIMAGMDSLTNGAGGSCWTNYFRDKAFAQLGCGGLGYIGLDNNTIVEFGSWGTSAPSIYGNETYEKYSLDRKGVILPIGGSLNLNFTNKDYDNCKIIYLKHPNGGKFDCKYIVAGATVYTVDTHGDDYDLGTFDLNGNSAGANGKIVINNVTDNEVIIFGVFCTSNKGGLIFTKLGKGGERFKLHANLDATFREKWLDILKPDYFLFNGGTNDEKEVQADEYKTLVEKYLAAFIKKDVKVTCISPNNMDNLTYLPSYAPVLKEFAKNNKCSYVNHGNILGIYEDASARGLQLDGCHPNNFGNEILANFWLNRFGLSSLVASKQFNRTWESGSSQKQYFADLSNKSLKITAATKTTIYTLGFLNAYTGGVLHLLIHGQEGKNNIIKEIYLNFTNGTTANQCTYIGTMSVVEKYKVNDSNIKTLDFDVTGELVNNKLVISITPNMVHSSLGNRDMYFNIKGDISCAYVGAAGDLVFEN